MRPMRRVCAGWVWVLLLVGIADAQSEDAGDLAKESQNPVGNLVSLPFLNSTSFGIGPDDAISNVQPEPVVAQLPNIQNQGETWSLQVQIKLLFPKG